MNKAGKNNSHRIKFIPKLTVVVFIFFFGINSLQGQINHWLKINTLGVRGTPYFLNDQLGFLYSGSTILLTTDGGAQWKDLSGNTGNVNQMYFVRSNRGYLASGSGIWKTIDTGKTWTNICPSLNCVSVYGAGNKVYAFAGNFNTGVFISTQNGGQKWDTIFSSKNRNLPLPLIRPYVFGNKDSIIYTENFDQAGNFSLYYSTDNGKTWSFSPLNPATEGLFSFPHCTGLLRTHLPRGTDYYPITNSNDFGQSWITYLANPEIGAWIAGNGCTVYVSNADARRPKGTMRSSDQGKTWVYTGGPDFTEIDDRDFHNLSVVGYGAVVYATDIRGNLWKTTDGADGTMVAGEPQLKVTTNLSSTVRITTCNPQPFYFTMQSLTCNYAQYDSIYIEGLDTSEYSSVILYKNSYCVGSDATVILNIFPHFPGNRKIIVHFCCISDEFKVIDRQFPLTLNFIGDTLSKLHFSSDALRGAPSDTLYFKQKNFCSAGDKDSIILTSQGCDWIKLISVRFESDAVTQNDFLIKSPISGKILSVGKSEKIIVDFRPKTPGIKKGNLIIVTTAGIDTIPVYTKTTADPPSLIIEKKKSIDFGIRSLCNSVSADTLTLSNPSCVGLRIKKISFIANPSSVSDISFYSLGPSLLKADTAPHKIFVDFHPQSSGSKSGYIVIETDIKTDTIPVTAVVLPDARILLSRCDNLQSPICDSIDGFVHFSNLSCREIDIESLNLISPFLLLPIRFPVIMMPGDSVSLPIRFLASQRGINTITANAKLTFYEPGKIVSFDTTLSLFGYGTHGASAYSLSSAITRFDTVRMCDSVMKHIILYSRGCDSLPLKSVSISGDADFSLSENGTRNIAKDESMGLDISLHPTAVGNKSAVVVITLADKSKVTIPISATVIRAFRDLQCNASGTMDFGSHLTCISGDTIITLSNPNCDTIRVSGVGLKGSGFETNTIFPVILLPGESKMIHLQTVLDTSGGALSNSAILDFRSDADNTLSPVNLAKSYIYPHPVHLRLEANDVKLTEPKKWKLKLKGRPGELQDVSQIDFSLEYNSDLLQFLPEESLLTGFDGKTFHLSGAIVPKADSTIVELAFKIYLTKDTTTPVTLSNISLNSSDPNFMGCVAFPLSSGTEFNYLNICGDPSLRKFMRGEPLLMYIRPNPAQDDIQIALESPIIQDVTIEIRSALGAKVFSDTRFLSSGANNIHLDTKELTGGMYFVRISSQNGTASESFVKMR